MPFRGVMPQHSKSTVPIGHKLTGFGTAPVKGQYITMDGDFNVIPASRAQR
ncbi:unnamed protein product, partial [marine sediment metagenome]